MSKLSQHLKISKRLTNLALAFFLAIWQLGMPLFVAQTAYAEDLAVQELDEHCPDHNGHPGKEENGSSDNNLVLPAGTVFCVKSGNPSNNGGATGKLTADGETTLQEYLFEAGIVDGSGTQGRDVSYYVVYEQPEFGHLEVKKQVDTDGDGAFDGGDAEANALGFRWGIDDGATDNQMGATVQVVSGGHTVKENDITGYEYVGWFNTNSPDKSCTDLNGTDHPVAVTVNKNTTRRITLCNKKVVQPDEKAKLIIKKDARPDSDQSFNFTPTNGLNSDEQFTLVDDGTGTQNKKVFKDIAPDTYTVTESETEGWKLSNIKCFGTQAYSTDGSKLTVTLKDGDEITCVFTNKKVVNKGRIAGFKFHDKNGNGRWNFGEPTLKGWTIYLDLNKNGELDEDEPSTVTNKFGAYVFKNLPYGTYKVCEQQQEGWEQTYPKNNKCHTVKLSQRNKSASANFGNKKTPPVCEVVTLKLSKTNDQPTPVQTGATVTYTLQVSLPEDSGDIFNVKVYDVAPEGFEFVAGSDLASQGSLTTSYDQLGVWAVGDMQPGDEATLQYKMLIEDSVTPGTYTNVAYAEGFTSQECGNEQVLSNVTQENNNPFVQSDVEVVSPGVVSGVFTAQTLGAATLANTGSGFAAIQFGLPSVMLAITGLLSRRTKKGEN